MAESMKGLKRTHRCTEVSNKNIGEKVVVMGWAAKRRNLGSLIFVDLRDRSGILQIVFDVNDVGEEGFKNRVYGYAGVCGGDAAGTGGERI